MPLESGAVQLPTEGPLVALRARPGAYAELPRERMVCVQGFRPAHDALAAEGLEVRTEPPERATLAIVHATRDREETLGLIARAWAMLAEGGWLIVDGDRGEGIDGIWKRLRRELPEAEQESKAHGRVIWVRRGSQTLPAWEAALEPRPNQDGYLTAAGMFSADGIDPGSAELATHLAGALKGRVADFGAGWGWLAAEVLRLNPEIEALDLVEAEAAALDCARQNVTDPRATFHWADATRWPGPYNHVIMNPPFHAGRKPDPALGHAFIAAAARALGPKGSLWMVANRHLAYEDALKASFGEVTPVAESNRYKVIRARKPRASVPR